MCIVWGARWVQDCLHADVSLAQGTALGQTDTGLLAWAPAGCTPGGKLDKPAVTSAVAVHNAAVAA